MGIEEEKLAKLNNIQGNFEDQTRLSEGRSQETRPSNNRLLDRPSNW
jgi:hypothetical protein